MHASIYIRKIGLFLSIGLLGGFPLLFAPLTQDYYDTTKWYVLILTALISLGVWTYRSFRNHQWSITKNPQLLTFTLIAVLATVATLLTSPNKIEAFLHPFGPGTFLALAAILFTSHTLWSPKHLRSVRSMFIISSAILGLIAVYQGFGMGKIMFSSLPFLADPLWTPTGSSLATIAVLVISLPLLVADFDDARKKQMDIYEALLGMSIAVVIAGLVVTGWHMWPRASGIFLTPADGWVVMLETLKTPIKALAGVGADNYLSAFSLGRPMHLNQTLLWDRKVAVNANTIFHLATIYGVLGLSMCLLLLKALAKKTHLRDVFISRILAIFFLLATPPSLTLLVLVMIMILLDPGPQTNLHLSGAKPLARWAPVTILTITLLALLWFTGRSWMAERAFHASLLAAADNRGTDTYYRQIDAITANPAVARFHILYSQTNLGLASTLSTSVQQATEEKNVTEQVEKDRQLVNQLIQQAIREAKIAVNLNTQSAVAWENLARVYQNITPIAQGADNWTIAAYAQAIRLDPTNPQLFVALCGAFVAQRQYDKAIAACQDAITMKSDYANAYYNLANVQKLQGNTAAAVETAEKLLKLLPKESPDWKRANELLKDVKSTRIDNTNDQNQTQNQLSLPKTLAP